MRIFVGPSLLAATALALGGCAGPKAPFDIGTQTAPLALVLGEHAAVVTAPIGPISTQPVTGPLPLFPLDPGTPVALPTLPPPPPVGPCPDFALTAPVVAAGVDVPGPPQPGTYL